MLNVLFSSIDSKLNQIMIFFFVKFNEDFTHIIHPPLINFSRMDSTNKVYPAANKNFSTNVQSVQCFQNSKVPKSSVATLNIIFYLFFYPQHDNFVFPNVCKFNNINEDAGGL